MNHERTKLRTRNALCSGAASLLALLSMALWIGGPAHIGVIVASLKVMFLAISLFAGIVGACFVSSRVRWSILTGALLGLAGGTALALSALSNI